MAEHKAWYKRPIFWVGILVLAIIILLASYSQANAETDYSATQNYSPTDSAPQDSLPQEQVNTDRLNKLHESRQTQPVDDSQLASQIDVIISANMDVIFGVSIQDLNSGVVYNYGSSEAFTAASTTKVLTAVDYLHEVELGTKVLTLLCQMVPPRSTAWSR